MSRWITVNKFSADKAEGPEALVKLSAIQQVIPTGKGSKLIFDNGEELSIDQTVEWFKPLLLGKHYRKKKAEAENHHPDA